MTDLLYITSPSFSGSTLLTFLLSTHPQLATIGELKASAMGDIDRYDCSCGTRIRQCTFWKQVQQELEQAGIAFDLGNFGTHFRCPGRPLLDRIFRTRYQRSPFEWGRNVSLRVLPGAHRTYRKITETNKALIDTIARIQGATVFCDASKDPVRLKYLLDLGCWNIKVLHLIRDGRGTACSYMKHYGNSMRRAATEFCRTHKECERILKDIPSSTSLTIHYEELCRHPDQTLTAILRMIGLDPAEAKHDYRSVEHHILGNSMRLNSSTEIRLDEQWRNTLSPEQLIEFDNVTGDLNRRYGYQ